jgi:Divergent InlB B-repeat domain
LQVTPYANIVFSGTQGGPFSPSSFHYTLSATSGSVKYAITTPSWLTASPKSGTVTTSGKTITFNINSSADKLVPNTYASSVSFNDTTTSQPSATLGATLTVNPKQFKITVEASPKADGTVSGGGTFAEGSSNTVTATPNTGFTFVHWTENGRVVSTSESYMFTLNGNVTLVADFR